MDTRFCLHPVFLPDKGWVPCGKCPVCRMKYRKQMAIRILLEQRIDKPKYSYFITLTYNDESIPKCNGRDCFKKDHVTTFLDSLKHRLSRDGYTYRYFLTCEYGEEGYRPHYHALLFLYQCGPDCRTYPRLTPGLPPPHFYFNDSVVQPLWKYGFTYQGTVTGPSTLYCTSYALKDDEYLTRDWKGFEEGKPFRRYSLRPGLGLTDKCVAYWLAYIVNDRENIRTAFSINSKRGPVSSGIPVGIKRRMRDGYPDEYDLLLDANQRFLVESMQSLDSNARNYGAWKIYSHNDEFLKQFPMMDETVDKQVIAFRKALRKMTEDVHRI